MRKFLEKLNSALKENKIYYLIVLLFFCIGIVIGVYTVMYMDNVDKSDITSYFSTFAGSISKKSIDYTSLLFSIIKKNLILIVPLILLSFTFFGSPIILLIDLIKGFSLGYTFTFILSSYENKGLLLAVTSVLPQNLLYIPAIMLLSILGLYMSTSIFKVKILKYNNFKKHELIAENLNCIVAMLLLSLLGMVIETYVSPNLIKLIISKFYLWYKKITKNNKRMN